jgi:hypothetical protein
MGTAAVGLAQKEDREEGIDEQDIFDRVILFLAAITLRLFSRVLGADEASFGAVMGKRGADAVVGTVATDAGSSSSAVTTVLASASETPKRCARAARERAGASPRVRNAASSAGNRTWIH